MAESMKELRVRFLNLTESQEQALRKFINGGIMSKSVQADRGFDPGSPKERREDVRVFLENYPVNVRVHKSKSFDARTLVASITDISAGGMSLKIPGEFKLTKNGTAHFELDILEPSQVIEGQFLGLQYED